jgi:hypothetical protein
MAERRPFNLDFAWALRVAGFCLGGAALVPDLLVAAVIRGVEPTPPPFPQRKEGAHFGVLARASVEAEA